MTDKESDEMLDEGMAEREETWKSMCGEKVMKIGRESVTW